jgi:hypothetical protein
MGFFKLGLLAFTCFFVLALSGHAQPVIDFTWPTNNQQIVTFTNLAGTIDPGTGTIQEVSFSITDQSTGLWWDGSDFQASETWLPGTVTGTNWTPAPGTSFPVPCCTHFYLLGTRVTDSETNSYVTNITAQADSIPPLVAFAPLSDGQTVSDLSGIGGTVTDNFDLVASVVFSIHELDINGGFGRWWNGTNFQDTSLALSASVSGNTWLPASGVLLPQLNSGQGYELTATATDTFGNSASNTITVTNLIATLSWDPGQTPLGTTALQNPNTNGGNYWFRINPQSPNNNLWRTALNVLSGEADVYIGRGILPTIFSFGSRRVGSDGFVLDPTQFNPGEDWYILVNASAGAEWTLLTGDLFVYDLGQLAADSSSGTNATVGAEGMIFYKTTIPSDTLAWRLWLNGLPNTIYVKKSAAPDPLSYDLVQDGQILAVPPFLGGGTVNGTYFVGIVANPGTVINLDSRKHSVADLPFNSLTNIAVASGQFPYRTFRVQVPVQQIAWQLNLIPGSGMPNVAVRRDLVPNEFRNDAFSETPATVGASVTLVPPPPQSASGVPGLSDGVFFVTVYSTGPYACGLTNSNPVITDVHFVFDITNDAPSRSGWRYYRVPDPNEQLGSLGWELLLANQAPGTEILLRRNAVPGRWTRRDNDNSYDTQLLGYPVECLPGAQCPAVGGFLQNPGHQADIWYIGVYTPDQALGSFVLSGRRLTADAQSFDDAGSSVSITDQPAGKWKFFQVDVPVDALGWDLRLVGITNGNPRLVVSRDTLPVSLNTFSPNSSWPNGCQSYCPVPWIGSQWLSGNQWASGADWTGCGSGQMLAMGMGNPLEAGTYYIGVQDPTEVSGYTLQSRGIGVTNYAIRVHDLDFAGGVASGSVAVSEGDYYRVQVPGTAPDWKLRLQTTLGEALLKVQRDYLPNNGFGGVGGWPYGFVRGGFGGQLMMKPDNEQWTLLPEGGGSNVVAGTYYVLVGGQGQDATNGCFTPGGGHGSGSTSYLLSSSIEPVTQMPDTLGYGSDLRYTNSQAGGEVKFYRFSVPANIASIEVTIENLDLNGAPVMYLNPGMDLVGAQNSDNYGNYGGTNFQWTGNSLITVPNPFGTYNLSVYAASAAGLYSSASYVVRVHAVPPTDVSFDTGSFAVADQPAGQWNFFRITVPADALGWDLRLVAVTNGAPKMVVSRETLPISLGTFSPNSSWPNACDNYCPIPWIGSEWAATNQWAGSDDWTGCGGGQMLAMGMGNPLEPGTYLVGVHDPDHVCSYTLQSRGIGLVNYSIVVQDLDFATGLATGNVAPREGDYYRVQVPSNAPNWKLQLHMTLGEALLKVQRDYLPSSGLGAGSDSAWPYGYVQSGRGGQLMLKPDDEQWVLLPEGGASNVVKGVYYIVVGGQGQNATNECRGRGTGHGAASTTYTLNSSIEPLTVLTGTLSYTNDLRFTNAQAGGEIKFYQFNVPPNLATIEARLERLDATSNPVMYLNAGAALVGVQHLDHYGNYGGTNSQWTDGSLITVPNPQPGVYSLSVYAASIGGSFPAAQYVLRVRAVPPTEVGFDGDSFTVTNQPAAQWQFFQIQVPAEALGWDLRLVDVAVGNPKMVVRRGALPLSLNTFSPDSSWPNACDNYCPVPWIGSQWSMGNQWAAAEDWTGCGGGQMLAMGMGNPLEAGTYFVGVQDPAGESSYTLRSRGIGLTNFSILVHDLDFAAGTASGTVAVAEGDYYRISVPSNAPDWKLQLHTTGEALLKVQRDFLPNTGVGAGQDRNWPYGYLPGGRGGQLMLKPADEQWALLPEGGATNVTEGVYYFVVGGQGQNVTNQCSGPGSGHGNGSTTYTVNSFVEPVTQIANPLSYGNGVVLSNAQAGGEMKFYQFIVPPNLVSIELGLESHEGNPVMYLSRGSAPTGTQNNGFTDGYGNYGGTAAQWINNNVITIPNPDPGVYNLSVYAGSLAGIYDNTRYSLHIQAPLIPAINLSGPSNSVSGSLTDNERAFYQVTVSDFVNGAPVLGWRLDLSASNGAPSLRVRKNLLPVDGTDCSTSPFISQTATIVPPYLTPGTWYVEVKGSGSTAFTLSSSVVTTNTLSHPLWVMPSRGQTNVAPGLAIPVFGDSGIDATGHSAPGDGGTDLKQGEFDYYAVLVPANNAGLLRTELKAISGNPDLYLRVGAAPSLAHYASGKLDLDCYHQTPLYDRSLTGNTTEYGNWVPLDGRNETELTPGLWVLAVKASGNANVRYRLVVSCGNPNPNALVQSLPLQGGSFSNQLLTAGDWRYFRVQIPDPAPRNWLVSFSRTLGSARMFIRDTVPPGDGFLATDYTLQNPITWLGDSKNQGPYPRFDAPGTCFLSTPPVRPGAVYYLGFWSPSDTTFSVSSSTSGGNVVITNILPFYGGSITGNIPPFSSVLYRMDAPADAARLVVGANNSSNVVISLEQGTLAQPGGPDHWTSYSPPYGSINNQADANLDQVITGTWPWLADCAYYLAATSTSASAESFVLSSFGRSSQAFPVNLSGAYAVDGAFDISVSGHPGNFYILQTSTNLLDWTRIATNTASFHFIDLDATNSPIRFYRTLLDP